MRVPLALLLLVLPARAQTPLWELADFGVEATELRQIDVARTGSLAILGAPFTNAFAGSAWVVHAASGLAQAELLSPSPDAQDAFGFCVAAHDGRVLVGAPLDAHSGPPKAGAAYLYDALSGQLAHTFFAPTPQVAGSFGQAVAMSEQWIAIAELKDPLYSQIHIYDAQSFAHVVSVFAPDQLAAQGFGRRVALSNTGVLSAAVEEQVIQQGRGAAYLFDLPSGQLRHKFTDGSTTVEPEFGADVALSEEYVLIGSPTNSTSGLDSGRAVLYDAQSGAQLHELFSPLPEPFGHFGSSVALEGQLALVGSPDSSVIGGGGAAFLFEAASGAHAHTYAVPPTASGEQAHLGVAVDLADGKAILAGEEDHNQEPIGTVWTTEPALVPPTLVDFVASLPASGGTYWLAIESASSAAGEIYLVLGSMSGTSPGLPLSPQAHLPLVVDTYTAVSLAGAGSAPFFGTLGLLDGEGAASFKIEVPPIPYAPVTVHHAALLLLVEPNGAVRAATSSAIAVDILP